MKREETNGIVDNVDKYLNSDSLPDCGRKRAQKACYNCRRRKARCEPGPNGTNVPCLRCAQDHLQCEISKIERRGGYTNVLAGKRRAQSFSNVETSPALTATTTKRALAALRKEWYNCNDALDILNNVSSRKNGQNPGIGSMQDVTPNPQKKSKFHIENGHDRTSSNGNPVLSSRGAANSLESKLLNSGIVKEGILLPQLIPSLHALFISDLVPFFYPFIPEEYRDINVVAGEPALLAVICTLGAKVKDGLQSAELHHELWNYTQRTVSGLMWECPDDKVRSLVYAVLLLCEWLPGAMYLDKTVTCVEVIKRYTRICWPLVGQAVRLARYVGLLERDIQAFITLHLSDHLLACRLGYQPMLGQIFDTALPEKVLETSHTVADKARLDIIKLLHVSNRTLYQSTTATQKLVSSGQHTTMLQLLQVLTQKWRTDYAEFANGSSFEARAIMFEFSHVELYIFSLALLPWRGAAAATLNKFVNFQEIQRYLDIAINAAQFIIFHVSHPENPVNLKHAPIQWIVRLLYAAVFLAKTVLLPDVRTNKKNSDGEIVDTIRKATRAMTQSAPGKYGRYCRLLTAICEHPPHLGMDVKMDKPKKEPEENPSTKPMIDRAAIHEMHRSLLNEISEQVSAGLPETIHSRDVEPLDSSDTHESPESLELAEQESVWEFLGDADMITGMGNTLVDIPPLSLSW